MNVWLPVYSGFTFYKMANLDNRIANADQLLTQDVEKFCDTMGELYSNILKVTRQLKSIRVHLVLRFALYLGHTLMNSSISSIILFLIKPCI